MLFQPSGNTPQIGWPLTLPTENLLFRLSIQSTNQREAVTPKTLGCNLYWIELNWICSRVLWWFICEQVPDSLGRESSWVGCVPRARVFHASSTMPSFFINSSAGQGGSHHPQPRAILPISIRPRHRRCDSIQTAALHFRAQIPQPTMPLEFNCYNQARMQLLGLCHIWHCIDSSTMPLHTPLRNVNNFKPLDAFYIFSASSTVVSHLFIREMLCLPLVLFTKPILVITYVKHDLNSPESLFCPEMYVFINVQVQMFTCWSSAVRIHRYFSAFVLMVRLHMLSQSVVC